MAVSPHYQIVESEFLKILLRDDQTLSYSNWLLITKTLRYQLLLTAKYCQGTAVFPSRKKQ